MLDEVVQGPCIICGYEDELDNSNRCGTCNPIDQESLTTLRRAQQQTKEAQASENK